MEELGGNIKLGGFEEIDPAKIIIVKKIVGTFVKGWSEKFEVKECIIDLKDKDINKIIVTLNDITETGKGDNLFLVLGKLLNKINKKC